MAVRSDGIWERRLARVRALQARIRDALRRSMAEQSIGSLSRVARDGAGDSIFGIDVDAEQVLIESCEEWGRDEPFVLVAEGIEPEAGRNFGNLGASGPAFRLIADPIDGTRGLMFDKRSAWSLAAIAPDRGPETRFSDIELAVMTELPTSRQGHADVLWACRDAGRADGEQIDLRDGSSREITCTPSTATDLRHGFATVCNFFQGGKELTARIDEDLIGRAIGGWRHEKAEVYSDHYISSGGQLAELALGRDRFVLDIRPLVHRALGYDATLCCRPYDLCTALVAEAAGCVVEAPDGGRLDPPLDTTTNIAFAAYANRALADRLRPDLIATLRDHGVL